MLVLAVLAVYHARQALANTCVCSQQQIFVAQIGMDSSNHLHASSQQQHSDKCSIGALQTISQSSCHPIYFSNNANLCTKSNAAAVCKDVHLRT